MSILIKGMEMPTSCDECRIMVLEDTNCDGELYCGCPIVFKAHPQGIGHCPDYCPLVEIPPHGDLVDRDALMDDIIRSMVFSGRKVPKEAAIVQKVLDIVGDANAIIPASEEGE